MMNQWLEGLTSLGRSLFQLTNAERRMLCVIIALAMLGLAVRWWHRHTPARTDTVVPITQSAPLP